MKATICIIVTAVLGFGMLANVLTPVKASIDKLTATLRK